MTNTRGNFGPARLTRIALRSALLLSVSLPAVPAYAADGGGNLEQVVVTARRRSERMQSVPVAVTAISGKDLKAKGVSNTNDLQRVVPSLSIGGQQRNESQFYLRGQTAGVINQGVHNPSSVVAYYLEVATPTAGPGTFFDMASVDVLKGPQGILFGRNTTGGAVLLNPQKPKNFYEGYLTGQFGNYGDREMEGAVNIPVVQDKLSIRVAGNVARRDGFTHNVTTDQWVDDRHYDAYRVSIDLKPIENLDNLFVADGRMIDQEGTSSIISELNQNASVGVVPVGKGIPITLGGRGAPLFCLQGLAQGINFPGICPAGGLGAVFGQGLALGRFSFYTPEELDAQTARQVGLGARAFASNVRSFDHEQTTNFTNITNWNVTPDITLKNVAGYRYNRINHAFDFAGITIPILYNPNPTDVTGQDGIEQFSEELQLQGTALQSKLKYILGFYYEHATPGKDTFSRSVQFAPSEAYWESNPAGAAELTRQNTNVQTHAFNDSSTSVFAHGEYNLSDYVQGLKIAGGARMNWDRRYLRLSKFGVDKQGNVNYNDCKLTTPDCSITEKGFFRAVTWTANISDQIDPTWLVYGGISRGYKSGGGNLPYAFFSNFKPEYVTSFELGTKKDYQIRGVKARTNLAAFHYNYRDVQISFASIANGQLSAETSNAPKADVNGFEIEQTIVPTRNLILSGYFSWLRGVFGEGTQLSFVDVKDRQLPYSPIFKYGASATYTIPLGDSYGALGLTGTLSWQDSTLSADPLDPVDYYKSYGLLNFRADWTNFMGKPVDLSFNVNNALNTTYVTGGYPIYGFAGTKSNLYGEPMMFFGQVTFRWGGNTHW